MSFIILRTYFIKCSFPFLKIYEWRKIFASILLIYLLFIIIVWWHLFEITNKKGRCFDDKCSLLD